MASFCCLYNFNCRFRSIETEHLGLRHRVRKHHFDQRVRMRAGLDVELRAIGFDQRLGQRQADAGILRGFVVLVQLSGSQTRAQTALKGLTDFLARVASLWRPL